MIAAAALTRDDAGAGPPPLLAARGLVKRYGATTAVAGCDLDLPERAFTTLLGPSGCGKTTILRMIGGFEVPDAGSLVLGGRSLAGVPPERRPVNTVFQSYALFPHLTVADNVAFSLRLRQRGGDVARRVARTLVDVRLGDLGHRYPHELSGGQQQRVAVARAIIAEPQLLLLDEPLSALDRKMRLHLQTELKDLQRRLQIAFVYVTHDQEEAFALSDLIVLMNEGRIVQCAAPQEIYARPANAFAADFIGGASLIPVRVRAASGGRADVDTPFGPVTAPAAAGLAPGADAVLVVRPEHLARAPGEPAVHARVTHAAYRGDRYAVEATAQGVPLRFSLAEAPAPGDTVGLVLDEARSFVTHAA
ncbi:ABC transporter ATP-binding protein [uncultured Methylobacterium sp.]|uniref:ABC transporter ATP-binding protein n=1 Tax=uncultured Methylobacterium sp. TaxID=157278 RepID=UPI0035CA818B